MQSLRVLTWHVHGTYLYYLAQCGYELYLPVKPGRPEGYGGRGGHFPWPANVHEVAAGEVALLAIDCVVYQSPKNYREDRFEILSEQQRRLPSIYLEHDPPREHPTDTRHPVDDPDALLVHVTPFNELMWDSGRTPTCVVEHGVSLPGGMRYTGELDRGLVVVNNLARRGRRLGVDVFERVRRSVPLDLAGMGSEELGGLGDVPYPELHALAARYRFFFHPIRYTSLGLAVCEAMMLGMPVVGLATTELATVIRNWVSGYVDTDVGRLVDAMRLLLDDAPLARELGDGARRRAEERFSIGRFRRDWDRALARATGRSVHLRRLDPALLQTEGERAQGLAVQPDEDHRGAVRLARGARPRLDGRQRPADLDVEDSCRLQRVGAVRRKEMTPGGRRAPGRSRCASSGGGGNLRVQCVLHLRRARRPQGTTCHKRRGSDGSTCSL